MEERMDERTALGELVRMSAWLGRPENDFVILGEGNTSARAGDGFFYVKESGRYLSQSDESIFVKVKLKEALAILDAGELSDEEIKDALFAVCAEPENKKRPSIETTFHAFLLSLPDVNFVGHTHPVAVNSLTCSVNAEKMLANRVFPDEIVYCGIGPIFMPYFDPGLGLAQTIREKCNSYLHKQGLAPKVIVIQNHGLIALGKTAHEVEAVTAMMCKVCRVLMGAIAFGGVHYMSKENVDRIYTRPDEHYRKQQFH
jgi:rhamnose utilization protein RhaD (predicted bifunctional aldolase and dehydrogenase)